MAYGKNAGNSGRVFGSETKVQETKDGYRPSFVGDVVIFQSTHKGEACVSIREARASDGKAPRYNAGNVASLMQALERISAEHELPLHPFAVTTEYAKHPEAKLMLVIGRYGSPIVGAQIPTATWRALNGKASRQANRVFE